MNELVFVHDQNCYITSIEAAGGTSALIRESSRDFFGRDVGADNDCARQLSHPVSLPNLNSAGRCNSQTDGVFMSPPSNDDDTASEWSVLGGVPLRSGTNEGASDWSFVSGILTPAKSPCVRHRLEQRSSRHGRVCQSALSSLPSQSKKAPQFSSLPGTHGFSSPRSQNLPLSFGVRARCVAK
jgi:hypothetical protein